MGSTYPQGLSIFSAERLLCSRDRVASPLVERDVTRRGAMGEAWFRERFVSRVTPASVLISLGPSVLRLAFKGETIPRNPMKVLGVAIPTAKMLHGFSRGAALAIVESRSRSR